MLKQIENMEFSDDGFTTFTRSDVTLMSNLVQYLSVPLTFLFEHTQHLTIQINKKLEYMPLPMQYTAEGLVVHEVEDLEFIQIEPLPEDFWMDVAEKLAEKIRYDLLD